MTDPTRLKDRVAVVTGGANGFGRAIVARLAAEGADVTVFDIDAPEPDAAGADEATIAWSRVDISDARAWQKGLEEVVARCGRLDILVNNAGINAYAAAHEIDEETWARVIAVNQSGVLFGLRFALPYMLAAGQGAIVNISSTLALAAVPGAVAYHATKGAVTQLTRNAAITYAAAGIRVNEVLPGIGDTRMVRNQAKAFTDAALARAPMGRLVQPAEIAAAVAFLASDDASFITGASLPVDGGYLAQ